MIVDRGSDAEARCMLTTSWSNIAGIEGRASVCRQPLILKFYTGSFSREGDQLQPTNGNLSIETPNR